MKSIETLIENFNATSLRIGDLLENVNKQTMLGTDSTYSINNLDHWLTDFDNRLNTIGPLSLDLKVLNDQEIIVQTLLAEINGRKPALENLLQLGDDDNITKIRDLENRLTIITYILFK